MLDYAIIHETIAKLVSVEDNLSLTKVPDYTEIRQTIFDMDPLSAPSPGGFTRKFFCHCWDMIGLDVADVFRNFLRQVLFILVLILILLFLFLRSNLLFMWISLGQLLLVIFLLRRLLRY